MALCEFPSNGSGGVPMGRGIAAIGTAGGFCAGGGFPPGGTAGGWIAIGCGAPVFPVVGSTCEIMVIGAELVGNGGADRSAALYEGPALIPEGVARCFPFEWGGVENAPASADVGLE